MIIVVGSTNIDFAVHGPRLPRPGETVLGGTFLQTHGGKGANQAVAAARLLRDAQSNAVSFISAIGVDALGKQSLDALRDESLDLSHVVSLQGIATGVALILIDQAGENAISVAAGANGGLSERHIDELPDDLFRRATVLLASQEIGLATVRRCLARARAAGVTTILNPAPTTRAMAGQVLDELLPLVDIVTPNETEALALGAALLQDREAAADLDTIASMLASRVSTGCIVTLGGDGCRFKSKNQQTVEQFPAFRIEAVDATGAGDAFNGSLAVAISQNQPMFDAIRFAQAAAACAVKKRGAQPSLPTVEQVRNLLAE